jgi:predicted DNA-binding transcriptional regulator YafY
MRADRLLSLLMLLQAGRRRTAEDLARQLEVSPRTIYRDLDALSSAGVPVYANRGPNGGVALLEGWRHSLTGLTQPEVQALSAAAAPAALGDLGLSEAFRSGILKVAAALPTLQQPLAEHARQRLHVDASSWFGGKEEVPHLGVLREGVWQDRKVHLTYRDFEGHASDRVVEPYALVIKQDRWYLVAGTDRGPSVFRGGRIDAATLLEARFERPRGFDLPTFWSEWCRRFASERPHYDVTLRLTRAGEEALRQVRPAEQEHLLGARRARDGTRTVTLDFEREAIAVSQLATLGPGVEVLEPPELRARLRQLAIELSGLYGTPARAEASRSRPRARRPRPRHRT